MTGCPGDGRNGGGGCSPETLIVEDDRRTYNTHEDEGQTGSTWARKSSSPKYVVSCISIKTHQRKHSFLILYFFFVVFAEAAAEHVPSPGAVVGSDALYDISPFAKKNSCYLI